MRGQPKAAWSLLRTFHEHLECNREVAYKARLKTAARSAMFEGKFRATAVLNVFLVADIRAKICISLIRNDVKNKMDAIVQGLA